MVSKEMFSINNAVLTKIGSTGPQGLDEFVTSYQRNLPRR